jgi:predicted ATP-grasp superfamily ATP-dependent carboligase
MSPHLLILGASVRAAAWSAVQAGYSVAAADLFADRDLEELCGATHRVDRYPDDLPRWSTRAPPGPWMYTGGLENYPELVRRISRSRPLWGIAGDALRDVRNPGMVQAALRDAGLSGPEVRTADEGAPRRGTWLRKPRRSCGGIGIERLTTGPGTARQGREVYLQQYIEGPSQSAVYVAHAGCAELLGVTRQLSGTPWTGARGFSYAGSYGPLLLETWERGLWQQIGQCLTERFRLRGLFGVDAIQSRHDLWPVEVNPRYTASVEVIERATGVRAIARHARAWTGQDPSSGGPNAPIGSVGKAILYATEKVYVSHRFTAAVERINRSESDWSVADIPVEGQRISSGRPVATLLVAADDAEHAVAKLEERAVQMRQLLASLAP